MLGYLKNIHLEGDKVIWGVVLALSIFSILLVYSTAGWNFLFNHLIKLFVGLFFLYQVHKIKFKYFAKIGVLGFFISIVLLILVSFWGWAWGLMGAVLGVPLAVIMKIALESDPRTRPIAMLLSQNPTPYEEE